MKIRFLLLLMLYLAGCQSASKKSESSKAGAAVDYVNTHIENEPPLIIPSIRVAPGPMTPAKMQLIAKERQALIGRLWQLTPIPVPGPTNTQTISAEVAHDRYVNFVTTYATDSILPLFQQRYARILLNDYHWLATGRADVIAYYVDQLLDGKSTDSQTITAGLVQLRNKLPTGQFASLLARALPAAEVRLAAEAHLLSEQAYWYKKLAGNDKDSLSAQKANQRMQARYSLKYELPKLKKRYVDDSTSVAQLRSLPLN